MFFKNLNFITIVFICLFIIAKVTKDKVSPS